jgi:23S rRNA (guanine2445-N2)-methyltransferase / 23S rRNA (guanine2069-N7)-methyltransferase
LDFPERGHQRGTIRRVVDRVFEQASEILNDSREAPWSIDVIPTGEGRKESFVELRPRLYPDPRLAYRQDDIPAASHPPLAACMARMAGPHPREVVWDPFCGSGTLLIEAAMIATRTAPGLYRRRFGFFAWLGHNPDLFQKTFDEVRAERILDPSKLPIMSGSDQDPAAVELTRANLENAGFKGLVHLATSRFESTKAAQPKGLIVTNPPYGVRLNEVETLIPMYRDLGTTLKHQFKNWTAGVITSEKKLLHAIGLKSEKHFDLRNGGLESRFSIFRIY